MSQGPLCKKGQHQSSQEQTQLHRGNITAGIQPTQGEPLSPQAEQDDQSSYRQSLGQTTKQKAQCK